MYHTVHAGLQKSPPADALATPATAAIDIPADVCSTRDATERAAAVQVAASVAV